jgi:hypothetical protein
VTPKHPPRPPMAPNQLTAGELSFLHWLRENGGRGSRSGGKWISPVDRLLAADYVQAEVDRSNPVTVHYTLTQTGRDALERSGDQSSGLWSCH